MFSLGMNLAYLEAVLAIVNILNDFDVELAVDPSLVTYQNALTLPVKGGLPCFIRNSNWRKEMAH
jgi:cytochrome P450